MRHSSSSPVAPSLSALHPVLQAAVENLDVQLEEELTRYRRQRRLQPESLKQNRNQPFKPSKATGNSLQLPQVAPPQPVPSSVATPPIATEPSPWVNSTSSTPSRTQPEVPVKQTAPTVPASRLAIAAVQPADSHSGIAAYSNQADLSAFEPSTALQKLTQSDEPDAPDDYLESSEELLRSIAEEEPDLRADPQPDRLLDTLLTPLGIGSMLLLLLSSATLGYVVMNPSSLSFLSTPKQGDTTTSITAGEQAASGAGTTGAGTTKPPSPDLAADEFKDLNLTTLSTIPRQPGLTPTAAKPKTEETAKPKAASQSTNTPSTASQARSSTPPETAATMPSVTVPSQPPVSAPAPAAYVPPAPAYTPPAPRNSALPAPAASVQPENPVRRSEAPAPEPAPEVAAAPAAPTGQNYLYVVTPYSGDSSLQEARGAVPDAYVRNFSSGARVQMGAFRNETEAQKLVEDLQQQGIQAEIQEKP